MKNPIVDQSDLEVILKNSPKFINFAHELGLVSLGSAISVSLQLWPLIAIRMGPSKIDGY